MRFPPPADDKEIMVAHGEVSHSLQYAKLGKCKECREAQEEFEEDIRKAGGFVRKLAIGN